MKRGDVVIVAAAGDYGKAAAGSRRADRCVSRNPCIGRDCQMTPDIVDAPNFRVTIEPNDENDLRIRSQVMADKPVAVRRERIGQLVGRLTAADIGHLNIALAFVMGLAD